MDVSYMHISLSITHSKYDGHDGEQDDGDADDRLGGDQASAAASGGRGRLAAN